MTEFRTERECTEHLGLTLAHRGYMVQYEVPFLSGNADLVAIRGDLVLAFEVKLRDHRKALSQAVKHLLFADRVYVALPAGRTNNLTWEAGERFGIGLVGVGPGMVIFAESRPSSAPSPRQRARVIAGFRERWRTQSCLT